MLCSVSVAQGEAVQITASLAAAGRSVVGLPTGHRKEQNRHLKLVKHHGTICNGLPLSPQMKASARTLVKEEVR